MKARYWSASARMEMFDRSTFCWRASVSSKSSGPSKPATSTISAGSSDARSGDRIVAKSSLIAWYFAGASCAGHQGGEFPPRRLDIEIARLAPRAQRRVRAPRRRAGERWGFAGDGAHLIEPAVAMQHHIAADRERGAAALGQRPGQGVHRYVVAHQQPVEPDGSANHVAHHCAGSRGRCDRVDGAKHNMRGHPQRKLRERAERGEI